MKAFDTDILTEILQQKATYLQQAAAIPLDDQVVPIPVVEELVRGRLNIIRRAEAGKTSTSIEQAYELFAQTLQAIRKGKVFLYSGEGEALFLEWRKQKVRGSTHDLRIAATCVVNSVTLISRNRRDFERIPGLLVEFWN